MEYLKFWQGSVGIKASVYVRGELEQLFYQ